MEPDLATGRCKHCGGPAGHQKHSGKLRVFCKMECKAAWQRTQKPVSEAWLREKYISEGMGTYEIAKIVNRNPKQVWQWLVGFGIPTRKREWKTAYSPAERPYQGAGWLWCEYFFKGRSAVEIGEEFGVTSANILFFLRRHGIPARKMAETRAIKHWGLAGEANGMYGVRGADHPNWQGGFTPERQAFYSTSEWLSAFRAVWKRDRRRCQRCNATHLSGAKLEVHHIAPFAVVELRAEIDNLVLLCVTCHDFVHGHLNTDRIFLRSVNQL